MTPFLRFYFPAFVAGLGSAALLFSATVLLGLGLGATWLPWSMAGGAMVTLVLASLL